MGLSFLPQVDCNRRQDEVGEQVHVSLVLPPSPMAVLLSFSQAFGSHVVLAVSPVELFEPIVGLCLGPVVLPFPSMWKI